MMDQPTAWELLDQPFRTCLEQAWTSLGRRGLPVGAALTINDRIIAQARNRVYDGQGGQEPLQATPLAHAEMNAVAAAKGDFSYEQCEIWSTQSPCSMCRAMIDFTGIGRTHYLATDPSDEEVQNGPWISQDASTVWVVVANVFFLHNVAWVGGTSNQIMIRSLDKEPEVASLALDLLDRSTLISLSRGGAGVREALATIWDQVSAADQRRFERIG